MFLVQTGPVCRGRLGRNFTNSWLGCRVSCERNQTNRKVHDSGSHSPGLSRCGVRLSRPRIGSDLIWPVVKMCVELPGSTLSME